MSMLLFLPETGVTSLLEASKTQVWALEDTRPIMSSSARCVKQSVESKLNRHETRIFESKLYRLETKTRRASERGCAVAIW
ncbi:hypothetical protein TNCV_4624311 [Trichonephila clavipes]|nr:hypothetical protein TNCV_4624311 [Trichonephila clavipes]